MSDEQIKQNAEEYAKKHERILNYHHDEPETDFEDKKRAYLAGAYSRNEEVELLKKKLKIYLEKEEEEKQKAWAESWGKDDWGFR